MGSILSSFPKIAATLTRRGGSYVDGRWVDTGTPEDILVVAPQPASGNDLQYLEDGERQYQHKKVWSNVELQPDDRLTIKGITYEVKLAGDWDTATDGWTFSGFHRALIRKVQ